jgi:HSP20 family protein
MAANLIPRNRVGMGLMERFREEMGDLFDRFFDEPFPPMIGTGVAAKTWAPLVDVTETERELVVTADLPGIDAKDVTVTVRDGVLVLEGERKAEAEEKGKEFHRVERFFGKFHRSVTLPPVADPERIVAESANGVITIRVPKKPGAVPRRIAIRPKE